MEKKIPADKTESKFPSRKSIVGLLPRKSTVVLPSRKTVAVLSHKKSAVAPPKTLTPKQEVTRKTEPATRLQGLHAASSSRKVPTRSAKSLALLKTRKTEETLLALRESKRKAFIAATKLQELYTRGMEPTPELFRHYRGHRSTINSVCFHPLTNYVATGGSDNYLFYWDYIDMNKRALRFEGHKGSVNDVAFNTTGDLMISGSDDLSIGLWVPSLRGENHYVRGHSGPVRSVAFNPRQPDYFMSASDDKTVKLWSLDWHSTTRKTSLNSHEFAASWCCHTNWVRSVRFKDDGIHAITASDDRTVNILDTRISEEAQTLSIGKGIPTYAEFNPKAPNYFGLTTNEEFHLYDIRTGKIVQCYLDIHCKDITKFTFHPSGDFVVTVSEDSTVKILDIVEGRPVFTLFGHADGLHGIGISPDGMLVGSGGKDRCLFIWKPFVIPYTKDELEAAGLKTFEGDQPNSTTNSTNGTNGHAEAWSTQSLENIGSSNGHEDKENHDTSEGIGTPSNSESG